MSTSKHFNKIAIAVALITLIITVFFMFGESFGIGVTSGDIGYENRLFDNSRVHKIDIVMNDFEEFINNAEREEYYTSTVVIDGEAYKNVAIRGKGNTSLSSVSSLGSDRYSFKIEFDHYDSSISYHGLDKLSLNNLIQDNTMMKDYVAYTAMAEFGVPSSLCSFVYITVNGEDFGLYLAVEGVEDSFLRRNYGNSYGELYKPDSMSFGGGRGNGRDFDMDTFMSENSLSDFAQNFKGSSDSGRVGMGSFGGMKFNTSGSFAQPDSSQKGSGGFFGGMGFGGMGSSDVKLQYTDDDINSYSNIWNNAKTDISEADQKRLINSLKLLSEGKDIESCVNITDVIRYFVVHNYVVNGDSYTGSMIHNYYLYEEEGILSMIPWDYNLAFGGFNSRDSVSSVNTAVDFTGMTDRPMVNFIFENEEYTELYHQYYQEFIDSVDIGKIIQDAYVLIDEYVEKDPTKFCTYEEFTLGVQTLIKYCEYRSESVRLQLENNDTASGKTYVSADDITISHMGSMGMGKGGTVPSMPGGSTPDGSFGGFPSDIFGQGSNGEGGTMPSMPGGSTPDGSFGGFPSDMFGQDSNGEGGTMPSIPGGNSGRENFQRPEDYGDRSNAPDGGFPNKNGGYSPSGNGISQNFIMIGISAVVLIAVLIFAKVYKRR